MATGDFRKILLIGPYPPPYGGVSVQVYELRKHLIQAGYDCQVLNIGESRAITSQDYICAVGYAGFVWQTLRFAKGGYLLHLLTNGHNIKSWLSGLVCVLAGSVNRRRTILTFGSGNAPEFLSHASIWVRAMVRTTLKLAGAVVCRNEEMRRALESEGADPRKVVIIPGFVATEVTAPAEVPKAISDFAAAHAPLIGAMGSLEPEYGLTLLIAAIRRLLTSYPRAGLVLIGLDPKDLPFLTESQAIQDRILCTGHLTHEVALGAMKRLDVFVRPTYFDGDANSVREAMALGVRVVASATEFRPSDVITFPIGEEAACTNAICQALSKTVSGSVNSQGEFMSLLRIQELYRRVRAGVAVSDLCGTMHRRCEAEAAHLIDQKG